MNTFLLLAGRSTRFWPLTEKTLFPVCGKTLLEHQVARLREGGAGNIILVGGEHNLEDARTIYPDLPTVTQENLELGMRGAVLSALAMYGSDPLMIVGGNDVIDSRAYLELLHSEGDGAILAAEVTRYFPGGYLTVDGKKVAGIVEKPGEGNEPSKLVNIVAHVHRDPQALLAALKNVDESPSPAAATAGRPALPIDRRDDGYEQALAKLFSTKTYVPVTYTGKWRAVKYPWQLIDLMEMLLGEYKEQTIHPTAEIHPSAEISDNVMIDAGVRVMANAFIKGPSYIGKNTIVANNALVRDSSIGDNCVIGYCTEVKASVFGDHVWTHMNYIGESVIGRNVSIGGGTITGNLRLDEGEITSLVKGEKINTGRTKFGTVIGDGARVGIHVSINPGMKIGTGSFISSQVLVDRDIPDNTFAVMRHGELEMRENKSVVKTPDHRDAYRKKL